jgi:hypothetical protein
MYSTVIDTRTLGAVFVAVAVTMLSSLVIFQESLLATVASCVGAIVGAIFLVRVFDVQKS